MSDKIKYRFPNGLEATGTLEDLEKIAKALGYKLTFDETVEVPSGYYYSETNGLMKISEMTIMHARNALLKTSRDYFHSSKFGFDLSNEQFLDKYVSLIDNRVIFELFNYIKKTI